MIYIYIHIHTASLNARCDRFDQWMQCVKLLETKHLRWIHAWHLSTHQQSIIAILQYLNGPAWLNLTGVDLQERHYQGHLHFWLASGWLQGKPRLGFRPRLWRKEIILIFEFLKVPVHQPFFVNLLMVYYRSWLGMMSPLKLFVALDALKPPTQSHGHVVQPNHNPESSCLASQTCWKYQVITNMSLDWVAGVVSMTVNSETYSNHFRLNSHRVVRKSKLIVQAMKCL